MALPLHAARLLRQLVNVTSNATGSSGTLSPPLQPVASTEAGHAPPRPPAPPAPPDTSNIDGFFGTNTVLSDQNLIDSAYINLAVFGAFMLAYCLLQTQSILYRFRQVSPTVTYKPPALPHGWKAAWCWFTSCFLFTDEQLLMSAGLDALMMVKMQTLGLQMFLPMAILGGAILIPINVYGDQVAVSTADATLNPSNFMRLTLTNVRDGSNIMWVHCVFVFLFTGYACWLLKWHYHQYVIIRQHYMQQGDNVNVWRHLMDAQADEAEEALRQHNPFTMLATAVVQTHRRIQDSFIAPGVSQVQRAARTIGSVIVAGAAGAGALRPRPGGDGGEGANHAGVHPPHADDEEQAGDGNIQAVAGQDQHGEEPGGTPAEHASPGPPSPGPAPLMPSAASNGSFASPISQLRHRSSMGRHPLGAPQTPPLPTLPEKGPARAKPPQPRRQTTANVLPSPRRSAPGREQDLKNFQRASLGDGGGAAGDGGRHFQRVPTLRNRSHISPNAPVGPIASLLFARPSDANALTSPGGVAGGDKAAHIHDMQQLNSFLDKEFEHAGDNLFTRAARPPLAFAALLGRIGKPQQPGDAEQAQQPAQPHNQAAPHTAAPHAPAQPSQAAQAFTSPLFVNATAAGASGDATSPDEVRLHVHTEPHQYPNQGAPLGSHAGEAPGSAAQAGAGKAEPQVGPLALGALQEGSDVEAGKMEGGQGEAGGKPSRPDGKPGAKTVGLGPAGSAAPSSIGPLALGAGAGSAMKPTVSGVPTNMSVLGSDYSDSDGWDVDEEITELPRWWGNVRYKYYKKNAEMPSVHGIGAAVVSSRRRSGGGKLASAATMPQPVTVPGSARAAEAKLVSFNSVPVGGQDQGTASVGGSTPVAGARMVSPGGTTPLASAASVGGLATPLAAAASAGGGVAPLAAAGSLPGPGSSAGASAAGGSATRASSVAMQAPESEPQAMEEMQVDEGRTLLSLPSVRFRKTVNTVDPLTGGEMAVNAQQYAVLVTDVNQDSMHAGQRLWRSSRRGEGDGALSTFLPWHLRNWMFHNYAATTVKLQKQQDMDRQESMQACTSGRGVRLYSVAPDHSDDELSDPDTDRHSGGAGDVRGDASTGFVAVTGEQEDEEEGAAGVGRQSGQKRIGVQGAWQGSRGKGGEVEMGGKAEVPTSEGAAAGPASPSAGVAEGGRGGSVAPELPLPPFPAALTMVPQRKSLQASRSGAPSSSEGTASGEVAQAGSEAAGEGRAASAFAAAFGPAARAVDGAKPGNQQGAGPVAEGAEEPGRDREARSRDEGKAGSQDEKDKEGGNKAAGKGVESEGLENGDSSGSGSGSIGTTIKAVALPDAATKGSGGARVGGNVARTGSIATSAGGTRPRVRVLKPGSKWAMVQEAWRSGEIQELPLHKRYSLVTAKFSSLFPDTFDRAVPVIKARKVDMLLQQLDMAMWNYQRAEVQYKYCGDRPIGRLGCCGLSGPKVDLIRTYRRQMLDLQHRIREERTRLLREGATPSWFVFFKTQYAAAIAAQTLLHGEDQRQFNVHPAPGPEEVNWRALWMSYRDRNWRGWIFKPLLGLIILIPIGIFTGILMQLQLFLCPTRSCQNIYDGAITTTNGACPPASIPIDDKWYWAWYCEQAANTPIRLLGRLIVSWVPSLLVTLWQGMVLPLVSYLMVQAIGQCFSLSDVDRTIAHWIWRFQAFNVLLGGIIGSTLASQIQNILANGPWQVIVIIGSYLPSSSAYFLNYLMIRIMVSIPMRLVQPNPVIRFYIFRRWLRCTRAPLTDRDKAFLYTPCSARYGYDIGVLCGIFLIAFAYAVISPIITIACLCFFAMSWLFWRYNLMYVYIRKYESGGMFWPFLFDRICHMLIVMAVFTACVFIVKAAYVQACLLLVLSPIWVLRFKWFAKVRFEKGNQAMPLELAVAAPPAQIDPRVYIPPPLNQKAVGWHPEWTKPWSGWGLPG